MKYLLTIFTFLFLSSATHAQVITTYAGNGLGGSTGDGGLATAAKASPYNCTFDKFGNFYFSEFGDAIIRKVDTYGIITTVAGNGTTGFGGDGFAATNAMLKFPEGVACDSSGNLFIADHQNYRIRKVNIITGIITTYAGSGVLGDSGDGDAATNAKFFPADIHFDSHNNLYISDNTYHKIRKVNAAGIITTYAGTGIAAFSGDGRAATDASLNQPSGITIDNFDNIYIADAQNKRIRKIDTTGIITTIAGTGIAVYTLDSVPATNAQIGPLCIAIDADNNIYFGDSSERIREIDASGMIHTVAGTGIVGYDGDGIPATSAEIYGPGGVTIDLCGSVYFSDNNNYRVRKISMSPILTTPSLSLSGITSTSVGGTVTVTATVTSAGSSYNIYWMNHGIEFATSTVPVVTYTKGYGIDTITARIVPTGYGCWDSTTSAPHYISSASDGVNSLATAGFTVYPNPANNELTIISPDKITTITITNLIGQTVQQQQCSSTKETINIAAMPEAVYFIKVTDEEGRQMATKIVVSH